METRVHRRLLVVLLLIASLLPRFGAAQQWNAERALTLVTQATERRTQQLTDSGLVDYRAIAHGYLTFLAQLGEGFREPPQVVKADELALEVYWRAPNLSKQFIIGRRDTTLLPTDISYHRDHLGIVQNNFPAIIRLGDGDEVRDVPHPLSPSGLAQYDYALTDSLRITSPGRVISVYEVKVRPKNDRLPRVIGALYLDRDNAQVVRMALSFTRAAFLDRQLEDLFVVLENGLVGTFWLPRRQEIEIRRTGAWMDYPVRGIIRGRWEISEYQINTGISPNTFVGQEIVQAPTDRLRRHVWSSANILDSLPPDIRAVTAEETRRIQAEVRELVREQALQRARGSGLALRGVSEFVRFNRAEGVALGAGVSWRLGHGFGVAATSRYGFEDQRGKGRVSFTWQNAQGTALRAYYAKDFRDVGLVAERSLLINSVAAQEFGSDYTNFYRSEHVGVGLSTNVWLRWLLDVSHERQRPVGVMAAPAYGAFEPLMSAAPVNAWRATLGVERSTVLGWLGIEVRGSGEVRATFTEGSQENGCPAVPCPTTRVLRASFNAEVERPLKGGLRLVGRSLGGISEASGRFLAQELLFLGGPVSTPGYGFHELVGTSAFSQHVELHAPVPFPSLGLGRFGRSPSRAVLAPHVSGTFIRQPPPDVLRGDILLTPIDPLRPRKTGFYPSAGLTLLAAFDLLRFDVSRGLRDGRWTFSFDVGRPFWSIL